MANILDVILYLGAIILTIWVYLKESGVARVFIIIFFVILTIIAIFNTNIKSKRESENKEKQLKYEKIIEYNNQLLQKETLRNFEGLTVPYIDSLGNNPIFKHHFLIGTSNNKNFKYQEAIEEFKKCLEIPSITLENQVSVNAFIGRCFISLYKMEDAKIYYNEALNLAKCIKEEVVGKKESARAYIAIGNIYYLMNNYNESFSYYNKGFRIYRELQDNENIGKTLANICNVLLKQNKYKEALEKYSEALQIFEKENKQEDIATTYNNICVIYKNIGDHEKALEFCEKSIEISKVNDFKKNLMLAYGNKSGILANQKKYDDALIAGNISLDFSEQIGDIMGIAMGHNLLGVTYYYKKDLDKALSEYLKSLEISEELRNELLMANTNLNIGSVYTVKEKYDEALSYYEKAFELYEVINDKRGIISAKKNIGTIYYIQKKYEESLKYYRDALNIIEDFDIINEYEKEELILGIENINKILLKNN